MTFRTFAAFSTGLLLSTTALAVTKVGIIGSANPMLIAKGEDGIERELYTGDTLFLNETLSTSETGSAQVMFLDRSALTISPDSEITIEKFVYNPLDESGEMSMSATVGSFRFIGGALSKNQPAQLKTPVSTMSIQGGIADTHVQPGGATQNVFHHGKSMSVTNGLGVSVTTTQPGTGFAQQTASATPAPMPQTQVRQLMNNSPVSQSIRQLPPASGAQIQRIDNSMRQTANMQPPAPANAPDQKPAGPQPQPESSPPKSPDSAVDTSESATDTGPAEPRTPAQEAIKPATGNPLPDSEISELRANPEKILKDFPKGGPKMASQVARAIATDPALADGFSSVMDQATDVQASAMGAGFVRGTRAWMQANPSIAAQLNEKFSAINDARVQQTYNAIGPRPVTRNTIVPPSAFPTDYLNTSKPTDNPRRGGNNIRRTSPVGGGMGEVPPRRVTPPSLGGLVDPAAATAVSTIIIADEADNEATSTSPTR